MPKKLILSDSTKHELVKMIDQYQKADNKAKTNIIIKTYYLLGQRTRKETIKKFYEFHKKDQ